ncbi:MAG: nucleotide sugar dehydrogenase [Candidatus Nitrosopumilus sp. bin_6a]
MNDLEIVESIQSGKLSICVIGIGRIGLPTALSFANSGLLTIGVDINEKLIDMINSGNFPLKDEPGYDVIFNKVIKEKKFRTTSNFSEGVNSCDVIVLSLPTPMDKKNIPDYSALLSVAQKLHDEMSDGKLIIIESTVEPGFVEKDFLEILEGFEKKLGKHFCLGVCPETANPGQILNDFERLPRLVGAMDEKTQKLITKIYKHVFTVNLIPMPDCKTANAVKLTTNVFRDLNIAFVNELALIFEKAGIDIMTVLDAAKTKYNFQVHYPSAGVGGPCLPVNSYQMINFAKKFTSKTFELVEYGRKINEKMPYHTIDLLEDALKEIKKSLSGSSILVLGVSYKPDVKDIQISPVEKIVDLLKEKGAIISIYDPYFKNSEVFGIKVLDDFVQNLEILDGLIIATAHKDFHNLDPEFLKSKMKNPIVIDSKNIIDQHLAKKAGLIYRGIGRGKI